MCHERVVFPGLPKAVVLFFHLRQLMFNKVRLSLGDIAGNLLEMEFNASEVSLAKCGKGVGIMLIEHYDGENECHKIIR